LCISTVVLSIIFQGFSISSNIWLSVWSNDDTSHVHGTENISKRNLYLTVYGLLGLGQGKINNFSSTNITILLKNLCFT